jgi:hypothetical protein
MPLIFHFAPNVLTSLGSIITATPPETPAFTSEHIEKQATRSIRQKICIFIFFIKKYP